MNMEGEWWGIVLSTFLLCVQEKSHGINNGGWRELSCFEKSGPDWNKPDFTEIIQSSDTKKDRISNTVYSVLTKLFKLIDKAIKIRAWTLDFIYYSQFQLLM